MKAKFYGGPLDGEEMPIESDADVLLLHIKRKSQGYGYKYCGITHARETWERILQLEWQTLVDR